MRFLESKSIKIELSENDLKQISSAEKIKKACEALNVIAFDIFDDEKLIGFAMLREYEKESYFLWNYAIDYRYQNKGYGTKALKELIHLLIDKYGINEMVTTYLWGNLHAKHVYEKVGFVETDVVDEDGIHEVNMHLDVEAYMT